MLAVQPQIDRPGCGSGVYISSRSRAASGEPLDYFPPSHISPEKTLQKRESKQTVSWSRVRPARLRFSLQHTHQSYKTVLGTGYRSIQ